MLDTKTSSEEAAFVATPDLPSNHREINSQIEIVGSLGYAQELIEQGLLGEKNGWMGIGRAKGHYYPDRMIIDYSRFGAKNFKKFRLILTLFLEIKNNLRQMTDPTEIDLAERKLRLETLQEETRIIDLLTLHNIQGVEVIGYEAVKNDLERLKPSRISGIRSRVYDSHLQEARFQVAKKIDRWKMSFNPNKYRDSYVKENTDFLLGKILDIINVLNSEQQYNDKIWCDISETITTLFEDYREKDKGEEDSYLIRLNKWDRKSSENKSDRKMDVIRNIASELQKLLIERHSKPHPNAQESIKLLQDMHFFLDEIQAKMDADDHEKLDCRTDYGADEIIISAALAEIGDYPIKVGHPGELVYDLETLKLFDPKLAPLLDGSLEEDYDTLPPLSNRFGAIYLNFPPQK